MRSKWLMLPALALILGGCSVVQKATDQVQQTAEQKAAEQEVRANCKYDKDVCEYFVAQTKMFSQPIVMTMTTASKQKEMNGVQVVTKMDGKGNTQSISTKAGKENSNLIIFDNATYVKDYADNQWLKMSSGSKDDTSVFNTKQMVDEMKETFTEDNSRLTVTKVGQEACGNLTCVIYQMVDENSKEFGTTKTWIDTKDHYARKMEITADGSVTTIAYAYEAVTIAAPSPVKEFSLPDEVKGQMPSQDDVKKLMQQFGDGTLPQLPADSTE